MVKQSTATVARESATNALASEWRAGIGDRLVIDLVAVTFLALPLAIGIMLGDVLVIATVVSAMVASVLLCHYISRRVRVSEDAIEQRFWGRKKRIAWTHIDSYQLVINDPLIMVGGGLLGILGQLAATHLARKLPPKQIQTGKLVVRSVDGTSIAVTRTLSGYEALVDKLLVELTERIYARDHKAFERGATVTFGELLAMQSDSGIAVMSGSKDALHLPFHEVASVAVERAELVIRTKRGGTVWQRLSMSKVRNHEVFVRLATTRNGR